ncbi:MAG: GspH/FimT family pseudopilin [Acidobacteriota bacterium]
MEQRGMSAFELLIVLSVVGIVAAVAFPDYSTPASEYQLDSTVREMTFDLHLARMKAISRNKRFRVSFNPDRDTYTLQEEGLSGWQTAEPTKSLPVGIDLVRAGTPVFESSGRTDGRITITLRNPEGRSRIVTVSIAGRVKTS